jgi:hypothetical protein
MTDNTGGAAAALAGSDAAQSAQSGATAAAPTAWYSGLKPETQGWLESKGWNRAEKLEDVVTGYQNLEKEWRTSDKLVMPKDENDVGARDKILARLGMAPPEGADKYLFPDGADKVLSKAVAAEFHKVGITQKQADAIVNWQMATMATETETRKAAAVADQNAADAHYKAEWGEKYSENIEYARRAMRGTGMNLEEFVQLSATSGIGAKKVMNLLYLAGLSTKEDSGLQAAHGDTAAGFGMTPNRAKADLAALKSDREFMVRMRGGDKAAIARWNRLQETASG